MTLHYRCIWTGWGVRGEFGISLNPKITIQFYGRMQRERCNVQTRPKSLQTDQSTHDTVINWRETDANGNECIKNMTAIKIFIVAISASMIVAPMGEWCTENEQINVKLRLR